MTAPEEPTAEKQIDAIIKLHDGWKGQKMAQIRAIVRAADPGITEAVKWKKPSRPEGVPVWTHDGNICIAEALKNAVRLTFPQGGKAQRPPAPL